MTLELEFPPRDLFPNRANGRHWGKLSKIRKRLRSDAHYATLEALQRGWITLPDTEKIGLHLCFIPPIRPGPVPDDDGCETAFKNMRDGIADALKINDQRFVTTKEVQARDPARPLGTVIVRLTAIPQR